MKTFQWPLRAFLFVCLLQIVSCTKTINSTEHSITTSQSSDITFPITNEFANCKLRRVYFDLPLYGTSPFDTVPVYGLFSYNSAGNPNSLLFRDASNNNVWAKAPSYFFFYDNQQRLKEFRTTYDEGATISVTHRYGYNSGSNRIATDTFINPDGSNVRYMYVSTFTYDSQGRIIKENIRNLYLEGYPLQPERNPTYTYDARGNLGVKGWKSSSYDNKVSIFRSHPIFQFIHRNYSKNNAAPQQRYNSKGLPLSMLPANDAFFNTFLKSVQGPGISKAVYDCQ